MLLIFKTMSKQGISKADDAQMIDRMEDTERLRSRMRERRRREVFEKAEKEEEREKAIFARFVFVGFWPFYKHVFFQGREKQEMESSQRGWRSWEK